MPVNTTKVAKTITKGAVHAEKAAEHSDSAFDIWSRTAEGVSENAAASLADPAGAMKRELDGRLRQIEALAPDQWASQSIGDAATGTAAAAGEVADAAGKILEAEGALATVGAVFGTLTSIEQMLSAPFSAIPMPAFPAVRITDQAIGLPHAHAHPPNLTPPNPVPVPLPSAGPVIPIPFLSGAAKVLVNNLPAGRCGDMGLGIWCGGYFPMYEIFLGSSSVWIEGARAARVAIDITKHCIFTTPRPSDPPIGPLIGTTVSSSPNVSIGGFPLPSLMSFAIGAAFKAVFAGLGRLRGLFRAADDVVEEGVDAFSRVDHVRGNTSPGMGIPARPPRHPPSIDESLANYQRALRQVEDAEARGALVMSGDPNLQQAARSDLIRIAMSNEGRMLMDDIVTAHGTHGSRVHLNPQPAGTYPHGPHSSRPPGWGQRAADGTSGAPCDTTVTYTPGVEGGGARGTTATPSDVVLVHELDHSSRAQHGNNMAEHAPTKEGYPNMEEELAVGSENAYRRERGLPERADYNDLP
jgi:hypothetical protein